MNGDMSLQNEILNCRMYLQPLYWAIKRGQVLTILEKAVVFKGPRDELKWGRYIDVMTEEYLNEKGPYLLTRQQFKMALQREPVNIYTRFNGA